MKTYMAVNMVSHELKKLILKTLETHEKYKSSYFWRPAKCANTRRYNEKNFPINEYAILTKQGLLRVSPHYRESCNNVYYSLNIQLEGPSGDEKKSIRILKQLIKETKC